MKVEIAKKWIAELRSGKWKQGRNFLKRDDEDGVGSTYCCLGVLCELAIKENVIKKLPGGNTVPNILVREWAGLKTNNGEYNKRSCLTVLNDNGKTFLEIAEIIEANIENL